MNPLASRPSGAPSAQLEPRPPSLSGYERAGPWPLGVEREVSGRAARPR